MTAPSMPEVYAQEGWRAHEVAPAVSGWGDAIPVDGVRPCWLPDDVEVMAYELDGREFTQAYPARLIYWPNQTKFALPFPRYDFVYLALSKGMVPWFGGDEAPGDWDGGDVLRRGGAFHRPEPYSAPFEINQRWYWKEGVKSAFDIIGYTRKATSTALPLARPATPQGEDAFTGHNRMDRRTMDEVWRKGGWGDACVANRTTVMRFIGTIDALEDQLAALAPTAIASGRGGAE